MAGKRVTWQPTRCNLKNRKQCFSINGGTHPPAIFAKNQEERTYIEIARGVSGTTSQGLPRDNIVFAVLAGLSDFDAGFKNRAYIEEPRTPVFSPVIFGLLRDP